jgi:hypothetical protein
MAQFLRPSSDISVGGSTGWYESAGGTQTNIYTAIDEVTRSDTDYIYSSANQVSTCQMLLSSGTDPNSSTGHIVRYTYLRTVTNKNYTLQVILYQGATLIASWTHANPASTFTAAAQTLTTVQADAITDYSDLRLEFDVTVASGGAGAMRVSWAELEIPDAQAAPRRVFITHT